MATGPDAGQGGVIHVYDSHTRQELFSAQPFADPGAGVTVAVGDVNGDHVPDVVAGEAIAGSALRVIDGATHQPMTGFRFDAYSSGVSGVAVASADVNDDGYADILTAPAHGSSALVKIFSGRTASLLGSFEAYAANTVTGLSLSSADVTGDRHSDIIVSPRGGTAHDVRVFDSDGFGLIRSFQPFDSDYSGTGMFVAAGNTDPAAHHHADIVVGAGAGSAPLVRKFDGATGELTGEFFAADASFQGGVRLALAGSDSDPGLDIVAAAGSGGNQLRFFNGKTFASIAAVYPYQGQAGLYVGGDDPLGPVYVESSASEPADEAGPVTRYFHFVRADSYVGDIEIHYTVSGSATNGTDYSSLGGTITIPEGDGAADVTVTPIIDGLTEGNETVTVTIDESDDYDIEEPASASITIVDAPVITISNTSDAFEGFLAGQFTVTRTGGSGSVGVNYTVSGSATEDIDYADLSGSVTATGTVSVDAYEDGTDDDGETVTLTITSSTSYGVGSPSSATVTIYDVPTLSISSISRDENVGTAHVTVTASFAPTLAASAHYATSNGSALAGHDYSAASGTVTVAAGQTSATFDVPITDDYLDEFDETVNLTLSSPSFAKLGTATGTLTIIDNDNPPTVKLSASTYGGSEPSAQAVLTVVLSAPSGKPISVDYATGDDATGEHPAQAADYVAASDTVDFPIDPSTGESSTAEQIIIGIVDDSIDEYAQTFKVTISNPTNATLVSPTSAIVSITDDDDPPEVSLDASSYTVGETVGTFYILVSLVGNETEKVVTVDCASSDGSAVSPEDYGTIGGTLQFNPPDDRSMLLAVDIANDDIDEPDQSFLFTLSSPDNATLGDPESATITILDDDATPKIAFKEGEYRVGEADGSATIAVTLDRKSQWGTVTVDYKTQSASCSSQNPATPDEDYSDTSGTLSWPINDMTDKTFSVSIINDIDEEETEDVTLVLKNPVLAELAAPCGCPLVDPGSAIATLLIADNDSTVTLNESGKPTAQAFDDLYTWEYTYATWTPGHNRWYERVLATMPDGSQRITYKDDEGHVMLDASRASATSPQSITFYEYNDDDQPILVAQPSAVSGYDDSYPDLLHNVDGNYEYLRDDEGLIETTSYYSTTTATETPTVVAGGVAHYVHETALQRGELGTPVLQETKDYFAHTGAADVLIGVVANDTVYANEDGSGAQTTSYEYTWYSNSIHFQTQTITKPVVATGENGSGTADSETLAFDSEGREIWRKNGDGFLTYTAYGANDAVVKTIVDVDTTQTGDFTDLPAGWSTPSGGGLHLMTLREVDSRGRTLKETAPDGSVTYFVYKNDGTDHEERVYRGWNSTTHLPSLPIEVTRTDDGERYNETLTMTATPDVDEDGRPTGTEEISDIQTLSRSHVDIRDRVIAVDSYFDLDGLTYTTDAELGTEGVNFYRTSSVYDGNTRLVAQVSPTGTITRYVNDTNSRVVSTWIGTDDTDATASDPTGGGATGNNMVKVSENVYDNGDVGDGNLTQSSSFPGGGADPRVTQYFFDWRDRQVASKSGVQESEDEDVNRPISYTELNNLSQSLASELYDGDAVTIEDGDDDGVPDKPDAELLRARSTSEYDGQGRTFRSTVFDVDQSSGTVSSTGLATETWYGPRGNVVKTRSADGLVSKSSQDGAGRTVVSYLTDGGGDSSWSDALDVTGDTVFSQTELDFDANGQAIQVTTRQRERDASGTGALGTATTGVHARVSYMGSYFDSVGRTTATVDVGTNGGDAWTRPSTVPSNSATAHVTLMSYNAAGRREDTTDPSGVVTRQFYDALGRTTTTIAAYTDGIPTNDDNQTTAFTYDGSGHILTQTLVLPDDAVRQTKYIYGVATGTGSGINSNDILSAMRQPDPGTGLASSSRQYTFAVDALGERLTSTDPNDGVTTYSYDVLGRQTGVENALEDSTSTRFDAAGRVLVQTDENGHATTYAYDGYGHRTSVEHALGNMTVFVFDATTGRLTTTIDAEDGETNYSYDALGRQTAVEDQLGNVTETVYDASGQVYQTIDPNDNAVTYGYDDFGRLVTTTDALSNVTTRELDILGRLVSLTDAEENVTEFGYDDLGRQTEMTDPLDNTATYTYDAANELISKTDRIGRRIDYTFDAAGNKIAETWYAEDGTTITEEVAYTYDLMNRVLSAENSAGAYVITYDVLGRVTEVDEPFDVSLTMTYDAAGNRIDVDDSFGGVETSIYDEANRLTSRRFDNGTTELRIDFTYDGRGVVTSQTRYSDVAGTTEIASTEYTYDAVGRVTNIDHTTADDTNPTYAYTYDDAGRLTSETINSVTTNYTHDDTNQLTGDGTSSYSYDGTGNRTNTGYETGENNQLTTDGIWDYTYDDEGNMTKKVKISNGLTWTYGYDNKNQLTLVERRTTDEGTLEMGVDYWYDAWGNRLETSVDHDGLSPSLPVVTRFAYDGWDPAKGRQVGNENFDVWADVSSDDSLASRYLTGDMVDQVFARVDATGEGESPFWMLTNHLGSIRDVADGAGNVVNTTEYDAFGRITNVEDEPEARGRYGWTGREVDVETGLQYNRARYYDPGTGRWLSQDPVGFDAGDSNLYRYVNNQPTLTGDPSGMMAAQIWDDPDSDVRAFGMGWFFGLNNFSDQSEFGIGVQFRTVSYKIPPQIDFFQLFSQYVYVQGKKGSGYLNLTLSGKSDVPSDGSMFYRLSSPDNPVWFRDFHPHTIQSAYSVTAYDTPSVEPGVLRQLVPMFVRHCVLSARSATSFQTYVTYRGAVIARADWSGSTTYTAGGPGDGIVFNGWNVSSVTKATDWTSYTTASGPAANILDVDAEVKRASGG